MKKTLSILLLFLSLFILTACQEGISVEEGTVYINVGEKKTIALKGIKPDKLSFSSSNEEVIIVDEEGTFTGVGPGLSTITTTYKKESWSLFVIVSGDRIVIDVVEEVKINEGETFLLPFEINDPNGFKITSSDEEILTVDNEGLITTLKKGITTVVITSNTNKNITKTVSVRVLGIEEILYDINLTVQSLTLEIFSKKKIEQTNNDPVGVSFISNDESIVLVDEEGNIEAIKEGNTSVIIKSITNPNVSKTLQVTVTDNRSPEEKNFDLAISNTILLTNYTLVVDVKEKFEEKNYYQTILLMFDNNLTKLEASQEEWYFEVDGNKSYEYIKTSEGFIKEEVTDNISKQFLLYENFTFDAFIYNQVTNKYALDASKEANVRLLDDFISLFTEDGVILLFELTILDGYINTLEFMFVYEGYVFSIEMKVTEIGNTLVEVPNNA